MPKTQLFAYALFALAFCSQRGFDVSPQEAERILLQRLNFSLPPGAVLSAEGALYVAPNDTMLAARANFFFSLDERKLWRLDSVRVAGASAIVGGRFVHLPDSAAGIVSKELLARVGETAVYPFRMAAQRFAGYLLKPYKKPAYIRKRRCLKVSVRPNPDENSEEFPFSGYFFVDGDKHTILRAEHSIRRSGVETTAEWRFRDTGAGDFPYSVTLRTKGGVCGFEIETVFRLYFSDIKLIPPPFGGVETQAGEQR